MAGYYGLIMYNKTNVEAEWKSADFESNPSQIS